MNFAGRKLKYKDDIAEDLTPREKRLLAENQKLKKKNKRLSSAMLFLVDHIEAKLPFLNRATPAPTTVAVKEPAIKEAKVTPLPPKKVPLAERVEKAQPKQFKKVPPPPPKKPKIVGKAWQPERLDEPAQPVKMKKPTRPLSMHQIFEEKKKEREESVAAKEAIKPQETVQPTEISEDLKPATQTSTAPETKEVIASTEVEVVSHTPELEPDEMDILAAPRDKKSERSLASSEYLPERKEKKTSAEEASLAYLAVSSVSKPVPELTRLSDEDSDDLIIDHDEQNNIAVAQAAQQNSMIREAMLRRVNRLRW
ncbi:hypothetical protein GUA87_00715 [Sneathiella sp. P13V-1]|uniref:hypothetical protein n=1 Tax=Sneathiella sp. P13V-1 TaxID=2697366 RepID=UPI00187BA53A|nr:hypothetical protein [Sneathiella sp. P13V-1]MBE7635350.1 hypothetical protein [Sneathiella sp. P13V-1]